MKHQTLNTVKFKRLKRALQLPLWQTVGILEALWIVTQLNAPRGDIGRLDNDMIAIELDYDGDADGLINVLVETGWLDECPEHRLIVHDWKDHAPRYIKGINKRWAIANQTGGDGFATKSPTIVADYSSQPKVANPRNYNNQPNQPTNQPIGRTSKGSSTQGVRRPSVGAAGAATPSCRIDTPGAIAPTGNRRDRYAHWRREWLECNDDFDEDGMDFVDSKLKEEGFDG